MTWLSIGARALAVAAVLPLLLTRFSAPEIALWFLLVTLVGLQNLADMGFAPTFVRVIAYAMGGASDLKSGVRAATDGPGPDWPAVERIWQTMHIVYARLTLGSVLIFAVAGSLALIRPIAALENPVQGWASWAVVVVTFAISMQGNAYGAYLQGVNQVALLRRWEAISAFGAALTSAVVLLAGGKLLALVIANQAWVLVAVARNRWLSRNVEAGRASGFRNLGADQGVMDAVWGSALRSGTGVIFSRGVILSGGLVYAQIADSVALAAYLVAFRVVQMLVEFSNAPFYSKLPQLSTLRAEGNAASLVAVATRGMSLAYWTFALGTVIAGFFAAPMLQMVSSQVAWPPASLWAALVCAHLIERFGAMHLQLYSTTNHIIWHKANGVSGTLYLLTSSLLLPHIGVYAFPVGMALGYSAFYSWYAPLHVYREFSFNFWAFQRRTVLAPALVVGGYVALVLAGAVR